MTSLHRISVACCALAALLFVACTREKLYPEPEPGPEDPTDQPEDPQEEEPFGDEHDRTLFTEVMLPVLRDDVPDGKVTIRYYLDMPNVPYISMADFQALVLPGSTLQVTWTGKPGIYRVENKYGSATVNTAAETFYSDCFTEFTNQMEQVQPGMENACYDGYPFVHFSFQAANTPSPVTLDYAPYGIDFRGDKRAVYLPLNTLADLYSDLYFHYAHIWEDTVIVRGRDDKGSEAVSLDAKRPDDLIQYSYGELCFVVDHFHGRPGHNPYEPGLIQLGLDKLLESSSYGMDLKGMLLSTSMLLYAAGLDYLMTYLYDAGHTKMWLDNSFIMNEDTPIVLSYMDLTQAYMQSYYIPYLQRISFLSDLLMPLRSYLFPDTDTYHKKGDTAICHLDTFGRTNKAAWNAFYSGTGPLPTPQTAPGDPLATFLDALKRADEDPEVKNLVIDLTFNTGGSSDVVMAMTSIMFDRATLTCQNPLTNQNILWFFEADRNMDGVFDQKDQEVHYDLNFTILISRISFSCGNLFPALCQDAGLLVAGEKSEGGSCAVGVYRTPEGFQYHLSSFRARLCNWDWENLDKGVTPQVQIEYGPDVTLNNGFTSFTFPNPARFYDLDLLSAITNEYYSH